MRITNRMIIDNTYKNAAEHLDKMATLQEELSSGMRVTKPSDDPTAVNQAMLLRSTLDDQDQYVRNVNQTGTWLDTGDQTLGQAQQVLDRARELAVEGASDTQNATSRASIAKEVRQLKEQLRGIANTSLVGRFLFAGSQTMTQPYPPFNPDGSATVYPVPETNPKLNNDDPLKAEIGPQIDIAYNITGARVFGRTDDPNNVFQVLDNLAHDLETNDGGGASNIVADIDQRQDTISLARAELGGKRNRIDLLKSRYDSTSISLKDLLSKAQEADMPQVISELSLANTVYQASLSASAKIIQPSLMDFLK